MENKSCNDISVKFRERFCGIRDAQIFQMMDIH